MKNLFQEWRRPRRRLRILALGGKISPAQLRQAAEAALALGDGALIVADGQTFVTPLASDAHAEQCGRMLTLVDWRIEAQDADATGHRFSTLPVHGLGEATPWLAEGVYEDVLRKLPAGKLSINLIDPRQRWFPRCTGDVQFMAAPQPDRWRPCLRPATGEASLPAPYAIHTQALPDAIALIEREELISAGSPLDALARLAEQLLERGWTRTQELVPAPAPLQPLEGFMRLPGGKGALGLASADFTFSAQFLIKAALLAQTQQGVRIGLTPWRGLLLRGIEEGPAENAWKLLLAQYREYALRAAPAAWFWRVPDAMTTLLGLRRRIIAELDARLGPAADWSFELADSPDRLTCAFGIVRTTSRRFDLYFNDPTNGCNQIGKSLSPSLLRVFLAERIAAQAGRQAPAASREPKLVRETPRHVCSDCLTEYLPGLGDSRSGVAAGTPFAALGADWECPVCGADKNAYAACEAWNAHLS